MDFTNHIEGPFTKPLSEIERLTLLTIARESICNAIKNMPSKKIDLQYLPEALQAKGASFVTLTLQGNLRGCVGALTAYHALALDVSEHAVAAAVDDYRFSPVKEEEIPDLIIEISRLTEPVHLAYSIPNELPGKLQARKDGVILRYGSKRATFLPQVWDSLPFAEDFLSHL